LANRTAPDEKPPSLSAKSATVSSVDHEWHLVGGSASVCACRHRRPSWNRLPYLPPYGRLRHGESRGELQRGSGCPGSSIHHHHGYLRQAGTACLSPTLTVDRYME